VVAARLPDDLAARFFPIDAEAEGLEGLYRFKWDYGWAPC